MSKDEIKRLVASEGTTRVVELSDGRTLERIGGSVSWRNNNPGNLKFEYAGSADKTVKTARTLTRALKDARKLYDGVVGLDQWGNAVFESYEAGRAAKIKLLEKKHGERTVEEMLQSYSTADYTGNTHHRAQADFIYREGERHGLDLRNKTIKQMNNAELAALADGIKGFEGWKVGTTRVAHSRLLSSPLDVGSFETSHNPAERNDQALDLVLKHGAKGDEVHAFQESLQRLGYHDAYGRALKLDGHFGPNTTHALKSFQRAHHLRVDGIAGKHTMAALKDAQHSPLLSEATHPAHALYIQVRNGIARLPHGAYRNDDEQRNAAIALTISAHVSGLSRIDHVVLGTDGVNLFAVQGRMDDPAHRRVHVEHATAMTRSLHPYASPTTQFTPDHALAMAALNQQIEQRGPTMTVRP